METSRRRRGGIQNYIVRIAAVVSQEHLLVTREATRPENGVVLVLASMLTWLLCRLSK